MANINNFIASFFFKKNTLSDPKKEDKANKGVANGYAALDGSGTVPSSQLPAYVDEIKEYASLASLPATGIDGFIYLVLDENQTYRWSGTQYVAVDKTIALGETSASAFPGDKGKFAYNHSHTTGNPHNTTAVQTGAWANTQLKRVKTEISWTGINAIIPTSATNLIAFLKGITGGTVTGSFSPLVDTVNNKIIFGNFDRDVFVKFSCRGTWSGSTSQPRSLQIDFPLAIPDTVKALRDTTTTIDSLTLTELIGLDKGGATALNGLAPTIEANNGTLTITAVKLVITQIGE